MFVSPLKFTHEILIPKVMIYGSVGLWEVMQEPHEWDWCSDKRSQTALRIQQASKSILDFLGGPVAKDPPAMQGTRVQPLVWEDSTGLKS